MNIFKTLKENRQKGQTAILLTLLILGVILLVGLGLASIFINELKMSSFVFQTGPAYYAAEAGSEYALYQMIKPDPSVQSGNYSATLFSSNATFNVSWDSSGINSIGQYVNTFRRIQITWLP